METAEKNTDNLSAQRLSVFHNSQLPQQLFHEIMLSGNDQKNLAQKSLGHDVLHV